MRAPAASAARAKAGLLQGIICPVMKRFLCCHQLTRNDFHLDAFVPILFEIPALFLLNSGSELDSEFDTIFLVLFLFVLFGIESRLLTSR